MQPWQPFLEVALKGDLDQLRGGEGFFLVLRAGWNLHVQRQQAGKQLGMMDFQPCF